MEIMIEVFDFVNNGQKKVLYRNTIQLVDGDIFSFQEFRYVLQVLYPAKYISFVIVPPPVALNTKKVSIAKSQ